MLNDDIEKVLITEAEIKYKIHELGGIISNEYSGKDLVMVSVLRGGVIFMADLVRSISIPVTIDFMAISSYGPSTDTSGVVRVLKDLEENINDRHVLIVEDIIDTGLTLSYLLRSLKAREPAGLDVCVLLDKSARRIVDLPIKYKGFDVPDVFVVGYGLDYRQKYRNLPYVGILNKSVYEEEWANL
ncbi:MAG: hypoxanthine phosphoribosyltransferase [Candidatus Aquicultor secundus]|uniref:hypoxanthine phosphoribosyltransferase n=1 Tax=Candidatus Aquicultor secundus TaxID=1973895 RepID=UPI0009235DAF|nr:hypoxanthine phosphoribosyltransferase [Candidatus Aquicultor secundus]NCO65574.1 hypoxanthine phosphoribosyltransferase [Solirubrobacter sp.]OIO88953.1 MAG: hypoxanthine phosphoribosyltransferase [Candidatus Aquicultor secundus]